MPEFGAGTWLGGVALLLVALALVFAPLLDAPRKPAATLSASPLDALRAEQAQVVARIREIDDDHRTGKLADADYRALRDPLVARGAQLLQQLDQSQA